LPLMTRETENPGETHQIRRRMAAQNVQSPHIYTPGVCSRHLVRLLRSKPTGKFAITFLIRDGALVRAGAHTSASR